MWSCEKFEYAKTGDKKVKTLIRDENENIAPSIYLFSPVYYLHQAYTGINRNLNLGTSVLKFRFSSSITMVHKYHYNFTKPKSTTLIIHARGLKIVEIHGNWKCQSFDARE
jgi:hypothetical protein